MQPMRTHHGQVIPLDRANVDTDQIIPKQFLKRIERTGYGPFLFNDWRYDAAGNPLPDFILNQEPYNHGSILLAGKNFGCGSSREHAAWALTNFGILVVIAPSFADIFHTNASNNGLLTVELPEAAMAELLRQGRPPAQLPSQRRRGEPHRQRPQRLQRQVSARRLPPALPAQRPGSDRHHPAEAAGHRRLRSPSGSLLNPASPPACPHGQAGGDRIRAAHP